MSVFVWFLRILVIVNCVFLIFVILLQSGRGQGLAGVFGGGAAQSAFGTKTASVLTKATAVSAAIFFVGTLLLVLLEGAFRRL